MAIGVKLPPTCSRRCGHRRAHDDRLPLAELEALAGARQSVLLPLLDPRVAGEQPVFLQRLAQLGVETDERARDAEPDRSGLTGDTAPVHKGEHVEFLRV